MSLIKLKKIITRYITSPLDFHDKYFTQFIINDSKVVHPKLISDYFYNGCTYDLKINNGKFINTIKGTSIEGQCLTGKKLALVGTFNLSIIYKYKKDIKNCHIINKVIPFSTFIIIPKEICENNIIEIEYYIEDVDVVAICKNKLFISVMLLLKYNDVGLY